MDPNLLEQITAARFPTMWAGCIAWSQVLTDWHATAYPSTWAKIQEPSTAAPAQTMTFVAALVASALHISAVEGGADASDGAAVTMIPLHEAARLPMEQGLMLLTSAPVTDPVWPDLPDLIADWRAEGTQAAQTREAALALANRVLVQHAEHAVSLGDRLRDLPRYVQAIERMASAPYPPGPPNTGRARAAVQATSAGIVKQLHMVRSGLGIAQLLGKVTPAERREANLLEAALADSIQLAFAHDASVEQHERAATGAAAVRDHDAEHHTHAGPVAATDARWHADPLGYLRQEYTAYLAGRPQPSAARSRSDGTFHIELTARIRAHHDLPASSVCGQGRHGHNYTITVELTAPAALIDDDVSTQLRIAIGELEHAQGPLAGGGLDTLSDNNVTSDPVPDERWFASWLHQHISARLPHPVGEYVLVQVATDGVGTVPSVHLGAAR
ncbi:hypothetical protein ACIBUY_03900 [Streptomyces sp. NPDC050085]|uniref:hypothetical protein n=1 Tax=Streptomyces sp. NPDC050085 TaxID=3365600 RepID=UPI0037976BDF